jgi:eukaryotic-like serine/threonine-protein kinase
MIGRPTVAALLLEIEIGNRNRRIMNLQIGDTAGDYEIIGELGAGGMGKVFRVRNLISDRIDAMKVLRPDLAADSGMGDRFLREIKVHASLVHPNIASLHTALRHGDSYLMIMELVEGRSLDRLISGGPLDPAAGVDVIVQVLAALDYAHSHGVIHRDIKPANIIVKPDGVVKVTDFGIARTSLAPQKLTATGAVLGTPYYMAPEQLKGLAADGRSDLYSVGVTLYEVLTGRRPFEGETSYEIMRGHLESKPAPPEQLAPLIPPEISQAILRALVKNPAERFQTAQEFRAALSPAHGKPGSTIGTATLKRMPPPAGTAASPDELSSIQANLLPYLGPIAPRLIAKAAAHATSRSVLVQELAEHIPDRRDREAFLKVCQTHLAEPDAAAHVAPATPMPADSTQRLNWDPDYLEKVRHSLAQYIGPIAGVLVNRTCKRVTSRRQLYDALAAHIPSETDRAKFLESVPL